MLQGSEEVSVDALQRPHVPESGGMATNDPRSTINQIAASRRPLQQELELELGMSLGGIREPIFATCLQKVQFYEIIIAHVQKEHKRGEEDENASISRKEMVHEGACTV